MKPDSSVQILWNDGEWRRGVVRDIGPAYVTVDVYVVDWRVRDLYPHDTLEAMQALHEATKAVTKARDAVVEAARSWSRSPQSAARKEECDVDNAMTRLLEAERAEVEARARLEALR